MKLQVLKSAENKAEIRYHCNQCNRATLWRGFRVKYEDDSDEVAPGVFYPPSSYREHYWLECLSCEKNAGLACIESREPRDEEEELEYTLKYFIETFKTSPYVHGIYEFHKGIDETFQCLSQSLEAQRLGLYMLANIGYRTALDLSFDHVIGEDLKRFERKLAKLKEINFIDDKELDNLSISVSAGHASAHKGWSDQQTCEYTRDVSIWFVKKAFGINDPDLLASQAKIVKHRVEQHSRKRNG